MTAARVWRAQLDCDARMQLLGARRSAAMRALRAVGGQSGSTEPAASAAAAAAAAAGTNTGTYV
jgi:hypothetical protein